MTPTPRPGAGPRAARPPGQHGLVAVGLDAEVVGALTARGHRAGTTGCAPRWSTIIGPPWPSPAFGRDEHRVREAPGAEATMTPAAQGGASRRRRQARVAGAERRARGRVAQPRRSGDAERVVAVAVGDGRRAASDGHRSPRGTPGGDEARATPVGVGAQRAGVAAAARPGDDDVASCARRAAEADLRPLGRRHHPGNRERRDLGAGHRRRRQRRERRRHTHNHPPHDDWQPGRTREVASSRSAARRAAGRGTRRRARRPDGRSCSA